MISKKEKVAKWIRALSVPPVMITLLAVSISVLRPDVFRNRQELFLMIALLGIVPVMAYPLQKLLPAFRGQGREGQRKLAFILNLIGYTAALIWALAAEVSDEVTLICSTYFGSVVLLTICNKLLHFKASGHASSFTGPVLLLVYLVGLKTVIPCVVAAGLIVWSSLTLKRHTKKELMGGVAMCGVSFAISLLIIAGCR